MIIHKNLYNFLEIIRKYDLNFKSITECELKQHFKNNEYYNLKNFCLQYDLIIIEHHNINLTLNGISLFNILKI